MSYFLSFLGIIGSFVLIRYREYVGDSLGDPEWAHPIGGIYNLLIIFAIFIFFLSIATMTGTTEILLWPIVALIRRNPGS